MSTFYLTLDVLRANRESGGEIPRKSPPRLLPGEEKKKSKVANLFLHMKQVHAAHSNGGKRFERRRAKATALRGAP